MTTVVSCLTPPGQSALATLALRGPAAWGTMRDLFRPRKGELPETPEVGRFWLGRLGDELADDVVLAVKGIEPVALEVHTHGGREVVRLVLELLRQRGVTVIDWQEYLSQTIPDPTCAAAMVALTRAATLRTAGILLDQVHGARAEGQELARWARLGAHLTTSWRVVLAGAPNVGKSSLANALAGYERCVVAPTPGTTRDVVTTCLAIDGWPVELADTAGLRRPGETLEAAGVEQARAALHEADLCLWLLDASAEPVWPPTRDRVVLVVNKIDLVPTWDLEQATDAVRVSARTGEGLDVLCAAIASRLVPEVPPPGAAIPFAGAPIGRELTGES